MPDIEEILHALPHAITPESAGPDLAAADVARGHRALRQRRRGRLAGVTGATAAGAVAAALALTSVPQPAAPARSASRAPAAASPLMSLAARISASDTPPPGNASLEILKHIVFGKLRDTFYGLYTDSGKLYSGANLQGIRASIAQNANLATAYDAQVRAAAREAATGDLAAARMEMIHASRNVTPAQYANFSWTNATYALNWAGGDKEIRVGVLRLLSTIPGVTVVNSTTAGQPTLTITAGPAVFPVGGGEEVLIISATTGLPVSSVSNPGPESGVEDFQITRVTVANIEAGKF